MMAARKVGRCQPAFKLLGHSPLFRKSLKNLLPPFDEGHQWRPQRCLNQPIFRHKLLHATVAKRDGGTLAFAGWLRNPAGGS